MFDFGIELARPVNRRYRVAAAMWSWTITFRGYPGRIWHIVRRTGNLKEWGNGGF